MIYADTSFISSCYVRDVHTDSASVWLKKHQPRLPFLFLHWPEIAKAIAAHAANPEIIYNTLRAEVAAGVKFHVPEIEVNRVGQRAAGLLWNWFPQWKKLRSLDAMHVAAAVETGAKTFLSFDSKSYQRVLATTQKMTVWPPLTDEEKLWLEQSST